MGEALYETTPNILVRVSTPFAGGIGGSEDELCGILSGGMILIGALLGRVSSATPDAETQRLAEMWREQFAAAMGATQCSALRAALPNQPHRCRPLVRQGVAILLDFLEPYLAAGPHTLP